MTAYDDALQRALEPLAGDPAADADRVLDLLPPPRRRPSPWPWLSAAAGIALGIWFGGTDPFVTPESPPPTIAVRGPAETGGAPGAPTLDAEEVALLRARLGAVVLRAPDGDHELDTGSPIPRDEFLQTGEGTAISLELGKGVEVRVGPSSEFSLADDRSLSLTNGVIWVDVPKDRPPVVIDTHEGQIVVRPGAAASIEASRRSTRLASVRGIAQFSGAEERELREGTFCASEEGLVSQIEEYSSLIQLLEWQVNLLLVTGRDEFLYKSLEDVADNLDAPVGGSEAEQTLRRHPSLSAMVLGMRAEALDGKARDRCVRLLCDLADYRTMAYLYPVLTQDPNPKLRQRAARTIERISGIPSERPEAFWADAPFSERFDATRRWQSRMPSTYK